MSRTPIQRRLHAAARTAGRTVARVQHAYRTGRDAGEEGPRTDGEASEVRIVCRRHVERRAVELDGEGRPACFDPDHDDCRGCLEDLRAGRIETW